MSAQEPPRASGISPSVGYMVMILLCSAGLLSVVYANQGDTPVASAPTTESPPPPAPTTPPKPSASTPPAASAVPDDGKLISVDLAPGTGEPAKAGDKVAVHYVGTLLNGTEFDASKKHGDKPFEFPLGGGRVIKGWDQGVVGMKVGGKRKLTIPPSLGYGARGAGSSIPPNSTLVFEVEMVSITPGG